MSGQEHSQAALYPGKDLVPISQEGGWAPGPVWKGGESRPHRDSIPDRPAQSLYRLSYRAHIYVYLIGINEGVYTRMKGMDNVQRNLDNIL